MMKKSLMVGGSKMISPNKIWWWGSWKKEI